MNANLETNEWSRGGRYSLFFCLHCAQPQVSPFGRTLPVRMMFVGADHTLREISITVRRDRIPAIESQAWATRPEGSAHPSWIESCAKPQVGGRIGQGGATRCGTFWWRGASSRR